MWYLRDRLSYLRDERGIETLEWILIGAILAGVAASTYTLLGGGLDDAVTGVTNFIKNKTLL
jgi:Flp pilus assembly pilin Flp